MNIEFPKDLVRGIFSIPKLKNQKYIKGKFSLIKIKDNEVIQVSLFTDKQVFHNNLSLEKVDEFFNELLDTTFNCLEIETLNYIYGYKISSKGKLLTNRRTNKLSFVNLEHNKKKNYIIPEGQIVPPLIDLGVITEDGKVVKSKSEKFKQINRFLEIVDDNIGDEKELKIIDFGCGKSYLSFIIYYYLVYIKKIKCNMIGLDLKEEVIDKCNEIAKKYNYENIQFIKGNISDYNESDKVDMIITLHACDTATDYALYHAIKMKCKYIFSVPCCQHEINLALKDDKFHVINKYGILKERFCAILTDAIRANILQYCGYKTQVLEYVDSDSSLKNVLIRATYTNSKANENIKNEIDELMNYLGVEQTLYKLIFNK